MLPLLKKSGGETFIMLRESHAAVSTLGNFVMLASVQLYADSFFHAAVCLVMRS